MGLSLGMYDVMAAGLDAPNALPHTASKETGQAILQRQSLPLASPHIIAANDRFARLLGSSTAEVIGRDLSEYASRLARPVDCVMLMEALAGAESSVIVLDLADGSVALNIQPIGGAKATHILVT